MKQILIYAETIACGENNINKEHVAAVLDNVL